MTTTDYSNRKVDLSLFPRTSPGSPVEASIRPRALAITGKLKASQNYLRFMLSQNGERVEDPEFGSNLLSDFSSSNLSFPSQISQIFFLNNSFALRYFKNRYKNEVPLEERIDRVELLDYSVIGKTNISLNLKLYTQGGQESQFHLPVIWTN